MYFFLYERSAEHHAMFINRMSVDKFGSLRRGITMQQVTISRRFCGVAKLDFNWSSSFKSLTLKSQTLNGERSECCTWIRWNFPRTSQLKCSFDGTSQVCEIFCSSYEMAAISTECRRQPFVLELCFVIFFEKKNPRLHKLYRPGATEKQHKTYKHLLTSSVSKTGVKTTLFFKAEQVR